MRFQNSSSTPNNSWSLIVCNTHLLQHGTPRNIIGLDHCSAILHMREESSDILQTGIMTYKNTIAFITPHEETFHKSLLLMMYPITQLEDRQQ